MKTPKCRFQLVDYCPVSLPVFAASVLMLGSNSTLMGADISGDPREEYVAHEWGTFTSIQGGDGALLDWNGIAASDLPPFVYNWTRAGLQRVSSASLSKAAISALQRMETPVIYFYPKQPMRVDVTVEFPKGQITEWFPQAAEAGPSFRLPGPLVSAIDTAATRTGVNPTPSVAKLLDPSAVTNSVIGWKNVDLLPLSQNPGLDAQLPRSPQSSHYFAARATASAFVRVPSTEHTNPAPEVEKFLFYRGVGNFPAPLQVHVDEQGTLTAVNSGVGPLKHLFVVAIHGDQARVVSLGDLEAGQTRSTELAAASGHGPMEAAVKALRRDISDALVAEGLYREEADAMVETWHDAWIEDQGVRVLYVLPRAWTDTILPITLNPPPSELVRVMVGRAEIITPAMAQDIAECVEGFRQSSPATRAAALQRFKTMKLGRFAQVAVRIAGGRVQDPGFVEAASRLIEAAERPGGESAAVGKLSLLNTLQPAP